MTTEFLLTAEELAAVLKVHIDTVHRKTRAKEIPSYPVGRHRRYRLAEVLAALKESDTDAN